MANSFDQFETLLREFISPAAIDLELVDDDPAWNMIGTFEPHTVGGKRSYDTSNSEFPAGYEARFEIKVQSGGRVAGGNFEGNTLVMMGKDSHLAMGQAASARYLDPTKTPLPAWVEIQMVLQRIKGSVTMTHEQLATRLATRPIDEVAGDAVEDAIRRLRGYITNAFYSDGTASIAQVNDASQADITETAGGVAVTLDAGTYARFQKGDLVVAGTDANPRVQRTGNINGFMRVVSIDSDNRTIKLQSEPGEGTITLNDDDHLMLADNYIFDSTGTNTSNSRVPQGVENLLISTGTFPGSTSPGFTSGLSVDDHTELKSFVKDTSTAQVDPTMEAVSLLLDKILDSNKQPPTAWIAERSLWTLHAQLERENNSLVNVPMGQAFKPAGGVSGPMISHMEFRFLPFNSVRVRPNSILGINPSTWMKYIPLGDRTVSWVYGNGPLSGFSSIFGPTFTGTQLNELADAPFNSYCEFGVKDPRANFRRVGLKTQRDV